MRNTININLMTSANANYDRTRNAIGMVCAEAHPLQRPHAVDLADPQDLLPNLSDSAPEPAALRDESPTPGQSIPQYQTRQRLIGTRVCRLSGATSSWQFGPQPAVRLKSRFLTLGC